MIKMTTVSTKTNVPKMTTKDLFIQEVDKHWNTLKCNEDTIFENIEIQLNAEDKFLDMKEINNSAYMKLISENSLYEKKKQIQIYFWDNIVGELYENTLRIMDKANLLEEANKSFEHSYKIEETARLILENGIFASYPDQKKKELVSYFIESSFYPATHNDKNEVYTYVEEGFMQSASNAGSSFGRGITNVARSFRSMSILLSMLLVSPATVIMSNVGKAALDKTPFGGTKGTSPGARKFYGLIDKLMPTNWIFTFLTKDQHNLFTYLKQANNLENPYVQDILKTAGADSGKIVDKCWSQNKIQILAKSRDDATFWEKVFHAFNGRGLANLIRDPLYNNENQLLVTLSKDAGDPIYQKRFFDFRICVYDKLFEIIIGYAKAIYSMDNESYEVIQAANEAHQSKNYKAFFDLRPKDDSDAAMFAIMKALVGLDDIARTLEKGKGDLAADKYIDRFSAYLTQNIKLTYKELEEMANLRKFNSDRYEEIDPDDDTKREAIQKEKFNAKKSIFEDEPTKFDSKY